MSEKVQEEASEVGAEEGVVIVDGPDGVAVALTPEAAMETSDRLFESAVMATGQEAIRRREAEARRARGLPDEDDPPDPAAGPVTPSAG